ncbi:MAG: glutamate--tRNA ligase [Candidatus Cloacimonetes bacterium]|nr:glutamate--tRNA ligase [Candidatus Cloacimonadota bacterium]
MSEVRVRFAPSPTGMLHLGGLRTALYNFAFARSQGGKFILRLEDTDKKRTVEGAAEDLFNTLQLHGIKFDEGPGKGGKFKPYVQSQRLEIYNDYAMELIEKGAAYYCFCSAKRLDEIRAVQRENKEPIKYDGLCRAMDIEEAEKRVAAGESYVIRLKMPQEGSFVFYDKVRDKVEIPAQQLDDQVIVKADGFPTYHLAATVDDHLMEITHVLRGEEWLSSTPKHIFIYESLGWKPPKWVHLPLILNEDKSKLSKRHGDFSVAAFRKKGYLREALINFVALLGWHPKSDIELFSLEELCTGFSLKQIGKAGAVFDMTKLDWMNGQYLRNLDNTYIAAEAKLFFLEAGFDISDNDHYQHAVNLTRNYVSRLEELPEQAKVFWQIPELSEEGIEIMAQESSQSVCRYLVEEFTELDEWTQENVSDCVKSCMQDLELKGKQLFFPIRLALYGDTKGPDIPRLTEVWGKEKTITNLKKWIK